MNTLPLTLHKVLEYGLGGDTWQGFVNRYAEKYNQVEIDGFKFEAPRLDYTFSQLIASVGAKTLPAYVDPESPAYESALREIQGKTGNIPTQKKFYRLNRVTVRQQLQLIQRAQMASLPQDMQEVFIGLLDEGTDGLIGSYYNALTHQRHQVVSTGKFTIDNENNPRGLKGITIDFGVASDHFDTLSGTARWWTSDEHTTANEGSASDPIKYLKDKVKQIRRKYHFIGKMTMEISQDLLDDMLAHSKVLTKLGQALYPTASTDAAALAIAQNTNEEVLIETLRKVIKVDVIKVRDSYAYVDAVGVDADGQPDIVTKEVANFDVHNIAFVPADNIGTIQGVKPLTLGYDADKVAEYDGGRLVLTQRANPQTHSLYIESESAQLCVPSVPQFMFISTVTA